MRTTEYTSGDIAIMKWRIGRKLGRTIYAIVGDRPSDDDICIGMMDSESIAAVAVLAHNNTIQANV
jgi:hypothetical protein